MREVLTCKDILDHILETPSYNDDVALSQDERFKILEENRANIEVYKYLNEKLKNLTIEVCGDYEGIVLDLMSCGVLEGWCWQTTESSIVFLNDDDYIERGNLIFEKYKLLDKKYYHSWINFFYNELEYTFDPCLNILCDEKIYQEVFETDVMGRVNAKEVRDELINAILNPKPRKKDNSSSSKFIDKFMEKYFGDVIEQKKHEIHITGNDDVNSPMYRNSTGYKAEIEDGKIKKLVAHFYLNG